MNHDSHVVIEPRSSRMDPYIHDPVVLIPPEPLLNLAARRHKVRKKWGVFTPARVYAASAGKRKLSLAGPCMGAPASVYVLERLIANGARNIIMLGLGGSLSPEVKIGDMVVADSALIEEGTSPHYNAKAKVSYPSEQALLALRKALDDSGRSYHLGPAWTTDAVFRETKTKVKNYGEEGYLAVEMECSALFTVAEYRNVHLGAMLVVSDELYDLRWRHGFTRPRFLNACRHACRLASKAALLLAGEEEAAEEDSGEKINREQDEDDPWQGNFSLRQESEDGEEQ
ncbi:MAG: nucleoside phosphorylase [bacterium]